MLVEIRPASSDDLEQIYQLIKYYANQRIILRRSRRNILNSLEKFLVAEMNDNILGVISYYDYGENLKEIRSLVIKKNMIKKKIGSKLINELTKQLNIKFPNSKIFVLTYLPKFFIKHGFQKVNKNTFPEKIWQDCKFCKERESCSEIALTL